MPRQLLHTALVVAAALLGTACENSYTFVSPTTPQGPPPFVGPPRGAEPESPSPAVVAPKEAPPPSKPEALTFFKTQSSAEWVQHNFHLQKTYARVIVVDASGSPPTKITTGQLDLEAGPANEAPLELDVTLSVKSLQEAASASKGGDLIAVMPGHYAGFTLEDKLDTGDERFIHWKALGQPGEVVIDRPTAFDAKWMIVLSAVHHVIIEGFNIAGANEAGQPPIGPKAGILINGDFPLTQKLAHHIAIVGNYSHHHKTWGLHSVDSHTVLLEDNLFASSALEHSAYVSDGSDDYVIRRNVFYGSNASGLQCNIDAVSSLEKIKDMPELAGLGAYRPTRKMALALINKANEKFGANGYPDGRGFNFLIEDNVINENGHAGGGAINLAGVRESLIQNNLVYGNDSSGIVEWDNGNPYDAPLVSPGPKSAAELAENLPLFGCFANVIRNNTVLTQTKGRPALLVGNGSWSNRVYNNILINETKPSINLFPTGIWRFDGSHNVLNTVSYEGNATNLKGMAQNLPDGPGSALGVTHAQLAPQFVRGTLEPWVLLEKSWWKLNPKRPDFRPRAKALHLAGKGDPRELPKTDLEGHARAAADIGAYAAAAP
ncbi:MAG: right-handed parallel beta-helix repeat-containing protein [Minicystis sp.]